MAEAQNTGAHDGSESDRIVLGLLNSVETDGARSQRHFASELGIALGLVNAYLNRCIRKGLVKVSEAPARRYAYYLTPNGFAEKSRLTVEYLSSGFGFFRRAKADCLSAFTLAEQRGLKRITLLGVSDLAEVAAICAIESNVKLLAIIDPSATIERFVGMPVAKSVASLPIPVDGVLVTALKRDAAIDLEIAQAERHFGTDAVLFPKLLARPRINGSESAA